MAVMGEKPEGALFGEKASSNGHDTDQRNPHLMPGSGDQVLSKYTLYETKR
jgi:hypothetical protein